MLKISERKIDSSRTPLNISSQELKLLFTLVLWDPLVK